MHKSAGRPSRARSNQIEGGGLFCFVGIVFQETKKLVAEVMRHMLFKNHQQPNVPVRREELAGLITKTYKQRHLPSMIITLAQKKLLATFGFEMKEYVRMKSSKAAKSANAGAQGNETLEAIWIRNSVFGCVCRIFTHQVPNSTRVVILQASLLLTSGPLGFCPVEVKEYVLESTLPEENLKTYVETPGMAAVHSLAVLVVGIIKYSGGEKVPEGSCLFSSS